MRGRLLPSSATGARFSLTPLIDMVFLLNIFFLVTAQYQKEEEQAQVNLPKAVKAEAPRPTSAVRLTIHVREPNVVEVQGRVIGPEAVPAVIQAAARRAGGEPMHVRIRADRNVDFGIVQTILLACARAGVWKVAFGVLPETESP